MCDSERVHEINPRQAKKGLFEPPSRRRLGLALLLRDLLIIDP